jgi:hypothetical protein
MSSKKMIVPKDFLTDTQKRICNKLGIEYDQFEKKVIEECHVEHHFSDVQVGDTVCGLTYRPTSDGVPRFVNEHKENNKSTEKQ